MLSALAACGQHKLGNGPGAGKKQSHRFAKNWTPRPCTSSTKTSLAFVFVSQNAPPPPKKKKTSPMSGVRDGNTHLAVARLGGSLARLFFPGGGIVRDIEVTAPENWRELGCHGNGIKPHGPLGMSSTQSLTIVGLSI
jgi:hypothetical protein